MRSLKSRLVGCALAGVFGTVAVVGCSASGDTGSIDPTVPGDQNHDDDGVHLSPGSSSGPDGDAATSTPSDGGKKDSGSKDAGKDAAKDAAPAAPEAGTACPTVDQIFKRSCGKCGMQEALCVAKKDGSPGGVVDTYGDCKNENETGCVPGSTEDVACGNCGTQKRTCSNYCQWTTGACTGQPTDSCTPGAVELTGASCGANLYRQRACKAACTWDNFSSTCTAPPTFVLVPPNAGSVNSTIAVLDSGKTMIRMPSYGTCPITSTTKFPTYSTPYAYIEVRNTNPKPVTVTIYNSQANGGSVISTVMAAYDGTSLPTTETDRRNCKGSVSYYSPTALTGNSSFASLDGTKAVTIAANSSVQVYFAAYSSYDPTTPSETTGMIKLNVRTDSVAP